MKLSAVKSEGLSKEIKIVIPSSDIKPVFEAKLAVYAKNFSTPGFRKGKVPAEQVKSRYGYKAFQEAAETLIELTQHKALEEGKIKPLSPPKISITQLKDEHSDIEYTLTIDLMPDLPTLDLKGFKSHKLVAQITDTDIQAFIREQLKDFSMYQKAGDKVKADLGGAVLADVTFYVDGKVTKLTKGIRIELKDAQKDEKIVAELIGATKGEDKTIEFDSLVEKRKHKRAHCVVSVLEVLEGRVTVFDDTLAKELGFESFDALKEQTLHNMRQEAAAKSRACLKRQLLDHIDLQADFQVPLSIVHHELKNIIDQSKATLTEEEKALKDEELEQEYLPIAYRRVRLGLLLSEIINDKNIKISTQELSEEVYRIAAQTGTDVKKIINHIKKNPAAFNNLQAPLLEEKAVDFLLSEINLLEKEVSLKDLDQYYDTVLSLDMPDKDEKSIATIGTK